jgi:flagellar export protein FliJ
MKRFVFSLETVLVLRRREEEHQRELYGKAVANRDSLKLALSNALGHLEVLQRELHSKRLGSTKKDDNLTFIHSIRQQRDFCEVVTQRVVRADREVEIRLAGWMEARKGVQVLEKLREKHLERHRLSEERLEERALDDLINARFANFPLRTSESGM